MAAHNGIDLTGQKFARLTVIERLPQIQRKKAYWLCRCDCGARVTVETGSLRSGNTRSCGCLQREAAAAGFVDLTGKVFERLTVVVRAPGGKRPRWHCRCACGKECIVTGHELKNGDTRSCGCLHRELLSTHGASRSSEYGIYHNIRQRCLNPAYDHYAFYGARGITICDRWLASFQDFLADMGPRPPGYTVDRIDNNGNYEPGNCRWASRKEQSNNTRSNRRLTHDGLTLNVSQWAEKLGLTRNAILGRLRLGWSVARALTEPLHPR